MVSRRFSLRLGIRLAVVGVLLAGTAWLVVAPGYHALAVIGALLVIVAAIDLVRLVTRMNRETARFLAAARHADFSQRFDFEGTGAGFDELGQTFSEIIERIRARSTEQALEVRHLRALIEHVPVPLLTVSADGSLTLQNNAARRLFGAAHVTRVEDLEKFGKNLHDAIEGAVPGRRELVTLSVDGAEYRLTMSATEVIVGTNRERLISLADIQSELDATQADAWQDLVKVLTHEIMNSITPVTSLASTAAELASDIRQKAGAGTDMEQDIDDLHDAVTTVVRRSESLVQFVDSYRQITRLAPAEKNRVALSDLFDTVTRLARAEWPDSEVDLQASVEPATLDVEADRDLLEPVLLNLLRNAWQATRNVDEPRIRLTGALSRRGNVTISVSDNGPGVPEELRSKVFVPFFTTREGGSGVGLALARQVMNAHGGFIRLIDGSGGATFTLTF